MGHYKSNTRISHGDVTEMIVYVNIQREAKYVTPPETQIQSAQVTKLMKRELLYNVQFSKAESQATQGPSTVLENELSRLLNLLFLIRQC